MQNAQSFRGLSHLNPNQGSGPAGGIPAPPDPQLVFGLTGPHHFLIASDGPVY